MSSVVKGISAGLIEIASFVPGGKILTGLLLAGASIGLEYLTKKKRGNDFVPSLQAPPPPLSQTVNNAVSPRIWSFGLDTSGGVEFYREATSNTNGLCQAAYLCDGPIDGIIAIVCDDEYAPWATTSATSPAPPQNNLMAPTAGSKLNVSNPYVILEFVNATKDGYWSYILGTMQVSGSVGGGAVGDANMAPFWDASHLAKGCSCFYAWANFASYSGGLRQTIYPNNWPIYRVVFRGFRVYDPRDPKQSRLDPATGEWSIYNSTWRWSENPALIAAYVIDRLIQEGYLKLAGVNWESIVEAADDCDRLVPFKRYNFGGGSGSEPFARFTGHISLEKELRDVLANIMAVCDGRHDIDQFGRFVMWVGKWQEPRITFGDEDITARLEKLGGDASTETNRIVAVYSEPRQNQGPVEAPAYDDALSQQQIGLKVENFPLEWCPSPSQAWRMARRHAMRTNGRRRLTIGMNAKAMLLVNEWGLERTVRLKAPVWGLDGVFEVLKAAPTKSLAEWTVELRETSPEIYDDPSAPRDVLQDFAVVNPLATQTPSAPTVGGVKTRDGYGVVNMSANPSVTSYGGIIPDMTTLLNDSAYMLDGRYSTDAGSSWSSVNVAISQFILQTPELASGSSVICQIRFLPLSGTPGAWSPSSAPVTVP